MKNIIMKKRRSLIDRIIDHEKKRVDRSKKKKAELSTFTHRRSKLEIIDLSFFVPSEITKVSAEDTVAHQRPSVCGLAL
jgi:hypothetical protein